MRVTNKGARAFFIWTLLAFVVMLCVIGWSMAEAFNLSPYTFKLRSKTTAADSLYIKGDTLYADQMAVSLAAVLKAVAVQTDTVRGSSSIVGVLDSAIRIDPDSSSTVVVITFGGYGGGLRWDRSTDAMQYTNDFSTWTDIGTGGSSTTNADSLDGAVAHVRPLTDGYYLRYAATGDSLYLAAVTGSTDEDSIFVAHKSSRWMPLPDSTAQYVGETSSSTMMDFSRADTILAFIGIYYGEGVADSMLMSKGWIEGIVGDSVAGKLDGINSSNGISGSASTGTANIQLDPAHFYVGNDTVRVFDNNAGRLIFNVFGTPTDANEMVISENNIEIRSAGSNGVAVLSGFDLERVSFGALGTMFVGAGVSTAPTFTSIHSILDTLFAVGDAAGDTMWANTPGYATKANVHDSLFANTPGYATKGNVHDSLFANTPGYATKVDVHDSLFANTPGYATKANVHDSVYAPGFATKANVHDSVYAPGFATKANVHDSVYAPGFATKANVHDSVYAPGFLKAVNFKDSLGTGRVTSAIVSDQSLTTADIDTTASNWVFDDAYRGTQTVAESLLTTVRGTRALIGDSLASNTQNFFKTAGNGLTSSTSTVNVVAGANGLTVNADSIYIDTTKVLRTKNLVANWVTPWPDSALGLGSGAGLTVGSSITLGTDITDSIRRDIQIPEYNAVVYPRGYDATDLATYDSAKSQIRAGHDATGSYVVCIDSIVWATDHSRYAVLAFPAPDSVVRLNRILIQASSAENAADSGMVWAGLKKNSVDSAGTKFHLEDLADRDSTSTSALDTLVLDNTSGLVPEAYTDGDVAYVVVKFTTKAGNGRSGVASYYIRKAWAEWVRDKL